jgi:hypothetical protein
VADEPGVVLKDQHRVDAVDSAISIHICVLGTRERGEKASVVLQDE